MNQKLVRALRKETSLVVIILMFLAALFIYISITSKSAYGGADNYSHYRIVKFAFKYPKLFFDHWGKPVFTILSSSFAQFGFVSMKIFNLIIALLTGFFSFLLVKKLNYKNSWVIFAFVCFTPIYFVLISSCLTEILFSFILIISIYLFVKNRFVFSAIVISFIIFSRTEGFNYEVYLFERISN